MGKYVGRLWGRSVRPGLLAAVAGISVLLLTGSAAGAVDCGALCGRGGSAGSVTVEEVLGRAEGSVPMPPATAAPIDRERPARVETAVFGLG